MAPRRPPAPSTGGHADPCWAGGGAGRSRTPQPPPRSRRAPARASRTAPHHPPRDHPTERRGRRQRDARVLTTKRLFGYARCHDGSPGPRPSLRRRSLPPRPPPPPATCAAGGPTEPSRPRRAETRVGWPPDTGHGGGFGVIPRHADVWRISLDQKTFSSERGSAMIPPYPEEKVIPQREIMLNMDPPRHTKYRRLVNMGFSPKILNKAEEHIRRRARSIVDAVARKGRC